MNTKTIVIVLLIIASIGIIFFLINQKAMQETAESPDFIDRTSTTNPINQYPDAQVQGEITIPTEPVTPSFPPTGTNPE